MKLLFVHQNLGAFGGAEANIQLTAAELHRRGHSVGLLYNRSTGKGETQWRADFNPCVQLPPGNSSEEIARTIREFQPDSIYLHTMPDLEVIETLLASKLPVVRMVHDHEMYCMRGYKYNYFTRRVCNRAASAACVFPCLAMVARNRDGKFPLRWSSYTAKRKEIRLNRQCDHFVVYSEYSKQELVKNGFPGEKIDVHVPIRCWGSDGPTSSFHERNVILYAGQIIRGKGVDILLRALTKVNAHFECFILGEGNHRSQCERLCKRLGLSNRVKFFGFIPHGEMERFYLEASVFVVSSVWPEPFGMAGPEAMRYGVPVVAFDAGGIRSWLTDGENGLLVPWMDTDAYARSIELLLRNKALAREMGRRGLQRISQEFDANVQIDGLEKMLQRVIGVKAHGTEHKELRCIQGLQPANPNPGQIPCPVAPM